MKILASLIIALLASADAMAQEPRFNAATGRMEGLAAITESASTVKLLGLGMTLRNREIHVEWTGQSAKTTWIGEVSEFPGSPAIFTTIDSFTSGTLLLPGMTIGFLPNGRVVLGEGHLRCGTPDRPEAYGRDLVSDPKRRRDPPAPRPAELRLGLPFSSRAAALAGSTDAMRAFLLHEQDVLNEGIRASGASGDWRIKVVGTELQPKYDEANPKKSGFKYLNEKNMKGYRYRKDIQAHLVLLVAESVGLGLGGSAFQYTGHKEDGYGLVRFDQVLNGALMHELGHETNMLHETGFYACPSGGTRLDTDFATVMWQDPIPVPCSAGVLQQYSNPAATAFGNTQTGDANHCNVCRARVALDRLYTFNRR
jgi:hypothetical protein